MFHKDMAQEESKFEVDGLDDIRKAPGQFNSSKTTLVIDHLLLVIDLLCQFFICVTWNCLLCVKTKWTWQL